MFSVTVLNDCWGVWTQKLKHTWGIHLLLVNISLNGPKFYLILRLLSGHL